MTNMNIQHVAGHENHIQALAAFHNSLLKTDWYTSASDDHSVYMQGEVYFTSMTELALKNGPAFAWMREAFRAHAYSGEPWGTEKKPVPLVPSIPSHNELIEIRSAYELYCLLPSAQARRQAIIEQVYQLGAHTSELDFEPALITSSNDLNQAFVRGQADAYNALVKLVTQFQLLATHK
tara:strand:+ start:7436 stop:7972 length:537 start_codon:yes stop_codon:yes gene_type:complete